MLDVRMPISGLFPSVQPEINVNHGENLLTYIRTIPACQSAILVGRWQAPRQALRAFRSLWHTVWRLADMTSVCDRDTNRRELR